jgi:hypothetical protein
MQFAATVAAVVVVVLAAVTVIGFAIDRRAD